MWAIWVRTSSVVKSSRRERTFWVVRPVESVIWTVVVSYGLQSKITDESKDKHSEKVICWLLYGSTI